MFEVLVDGGVEVLGVALVQAVDLPPGLDLHVPLGQDELADGLSVKRKPDADEHRVDIEKRRTEDALRVRD